MCYCDKSENEILDHLKRGPVPDDAPPSSLLLAKDLSGERETV